jgi:hypothetical protein
MKLLVIIVLFIVFGTGVVFGTSVLRL